MFFDGGRTTPSGIGSSAVLGCGGGDKFRGGSCVMAKSEPESALEVLDVCAAGKAHCAVVRPRVPERERQPVPQDGS
jgi:hypothetical protein